MSDPKVVPLMPKREPGAHGLFTAAEVAKRWSCTVDHVRRTLKHTNWTRPGKYILYRIEDVLAYEEEMERRQR